MREGGSEAGSGYCVSGMVLVELGEEGSQAHGCATEIAKLDLFDLSLLIAIAESSWPPLPSCETRQ